MAKTGRLADFPGGQGTRGGRGHCLRSPLAGEQGGVAMQQKLHWLDYDPVALAVLAIGMAMIGLFALLI
jgi:hypothetical protein